MTETSLREAPLIFRSALEEGHPERGTDTLRLLPWAEALRDFVHSCDTPMTVGIQGDWGIGKTSLMNMLRGVEGEPSGLLDPHRCRMVSLETWPYSQFNDGNELVVACLGALTARTAAALRGAQTDAAVVEQAAEDAVSSLASVRALLEGGASAEAIERADVSALMITFRECFAALVRAWAGDDPGRRLVVFVDDLDRVAPAETLLLLEAIKNFCDAPGCVFVLAVDYEVIQQGVTERMGTVVQRTHGKALYDKIVQLPFVMPTASYEIEPYIMGLLRRSGFPFADELMSDPGCREFLVKITLCTVGRNPRNIKRVMNYAALLERVRERQGESELDLEDAQILYALVSMQIAWPELFQFFVNDPTIDTVTNLQNWTFLDQMPEMRGLFERHPDRERLKAQVGAFFDRLFSLLDRNDDGQIDSRELAPVLEVMSLTRMTAVESRERPRDWFIRRVRENNQDNEPLVESFLERVFMRSIWYLGSECRYRKTGDRYVTLVHAGRQIGSLVTLRNEPFVFRLALAPERVRAGLKAYWRSKETVRTDAITFTRSVFGKEASMTGFGDTVVDYSKMTNMPSDEAVGLLNALFRIAIEDELPEWELDLGGKKKK
ncbi:MAG: P-loop NTPase fold protein [Gammaproteobacteria bacterium]